METSATIDYNPLFIAFLDGKSDTIGNRIYHRKFPDPDDLTLPAAVITCFGGLQRIRLMLIVRAETEQEAFEAWKNLDSALNMEAPEITNVKFCTMEEGSSIPTEDKDSEKPERLSFYSVELI